MQFTARAVATSILVLAIETLPDGWRRFDVVGIDFYLIVRLFVVDVVRSTGSSWWWCYGMNASR